MKQSKRVSANMSLVDNTKVYSPAEALELAKKTANTKFVGTVEIHVRTNIDPKKTEQAIRGSVSLPHGTGKKKRIAAFVTDNKSKDAKEAGADLVGGEELIEQIKQSGKTDFDIAVAEPAMMPKLAQIAKILGTRGLMPNPKTGTVSENISAAIKEITGGKISFKNDDSGVVHSILGKTDFELAQLQENLQVLLKALKESKPVAVKNQLIHSVSINASMGPGIKVKV
jgi:large subunit ribosomal protein L1